MYSYDIIIYTYIWFCSCGYMLMLCKPQFLWMLKLSITTHKCIRNIFMYMHVCITCIYIHVRVHMHIHTHTYICIYKCILYICIYVILYIYPSEKLLGDGILTPMPLFFFFLYHLLRTERHNVLVPENQFWVSRGRYYWTGSTPALFQEAFLADCTYIYIFIYVYIN